MHTAFKIIAATLALAACMTALGTFASLLFDAFAGTRNEFGIAETALLAALLVGQCRILWILVDPKGRSRADDQDVSDSAPTGVGPQRQHA